MQSAPPFALWFFLLIAVGATVYYAAIVSGLYKDPMMAEFRRYGDERRIYPLCWLLIWFGIVAFLLAALIPALASPQSYIRRVFPSAFFLTLSFILWVAAYVVLRQPRLRAALPRWYFFLLLEASRQERRQLGYAWLRLPRRMRWHLNGDQQAFAVWVELMRLTVIYGAYDPSSPWHVWE